MSLFDLTGRVAVITGSTKGIGLGIAQQMAAQGAKVVVSSRDQAFCDEVAGRINRERGADVAKGLACDIDDLTSIARFAEAAPKLWGGVDILVCNAAILPYIGPSAQTPPDLFDRILIGNVHHNFRLCQAMRGELKKRAGNIVLIGSEAGHTASPLVLAYAAAKAGVAHMALCLADEMAADRIRVNCVAPGLIRSAASTETLGDAGLEAAGHGMPLGRVGEPEDIAGAVLYLAAPAGSHVTGATIVVDGGRAHLSAPNQAQMLESVAGTSYS